MTDIQRWCCGPDGRPDFRKMTDFMERHERGSRFDAIGWALFFVWVGVAWLAGFSLGTGLLGVAIITVGMQGIRKICGVPIDWSWILIGLGFSRQRAYGGGLIYKSHWRRLFLLSLEFCSQLLRHVTADRH